MEAAAGRNLRVTVGTTLSSLASFDDRLEDDDFDLIEENLGVKVKRGVSVFLCLYPWGRKKPLKFSDSGWGGALRTAGEWQREHGSVSSYCGAQLWMPVKDLSKFPG